MKQWRGTTLSESEKQQDLREKTDAKKKPELAEEKQKQQDDENMRAVEEFWNSDRGKEIENDAREAAAKKRRRSMGTC